MAEPVNILVVDDDPEIRHLVTDYLSSEGFVVEAAASAHETWEKLESFTPDVVLLDVRLPDDDGMAMAGRLRKGADFGIIMLTAKTEVVDRVLGLESGADDYVSKPFHLRELLARIRSVMRRRTRRKSKTAAGAVTFSGWTFNLETRVLTSPAQEAVDITSKEFQLLKLLVDKAGETVTRADIATHFGSRDWNPLARNIDVLIFQLRSKIEVDPGHPELIKTVRGAGYIFTGKVENSQPR